jgi:SAM-dependent methyltransferase
VDEAFRAHYELGIEEGRLYREDGTARLELRRTLELLDRFLPPPPADVLDVGGGPGLYSSILRERGYRMRLVDVLPLHVEQARGRGIDARVGDARALDDPEGSYEAVLLLGPLYHLTERTDRLQALTEARRVAKTGSVVVAAAISRYTSLLDGLVQGFLADPEFQEIVERDLAGEPHLNPYPTERPEWFTTAYFHYPDDLAAEAAEAGLADVAVYGVEGPGWMFPHLPEEVRLRAARVVETDVAMLAASGHLLVVGFAP